LGEIADALRRAREAQPSDARREIRPPAPSTAQSSLQLPRGATEPPRSTTAGDSRLRPAAPATRVVESLASADPSLALYDEAALDACRRVALRIRTALSRAGGRSLAIVSAVRGEGKTTVTCDLAIAMASIYKEGEVALVDVDMRNPSVARRLGIEVDTGVEQFLSGDASLDELRIRIQRPSFDLYPIGAPVREAHELLVSPRFGQMIHELEARHALVVIDTPACLVASDTAIVLEHVSSCVLMARFGVTRTRNFRQLVASVPRTKVIGQVMNGMQVPRHRYYDYYGPDAGEGAAAVSEREAS
jgi:Mrp family chromosome partitioning ATPase